MISVISMVCSVNTVHSSESRKEYGLSVVKARITSAARPVVDDDVVDAGKVNMNSFSVGLNSLLS